MADASSTESIRDLSTGFDDAADGWVEGSGTCCHSEGVVGLLKEDWDGTAGADCPLATCNFQS